MKTLATILGLLLGLGLQAQGLRDPAFLALLGRPAALGSNVLNFATQPDGAIATNDLIQQPVVSAFSGTTVSLAKLYGPGVISGTTSMVASAGAATFTNVAFSLPGHYVLQASASGSSPVNSGGITVIPALTTSRSILTFGSNTTDKVDFGNPASLDDLGAGTFSVLAVITRNNTGNNQYFVSKYTNSQTGWAFAIDDSLGVGKLQVNFGRSVLDAIVVSTNAAPIVTGQTYLVGFDWNINDGTRQIRLYQTLANVTLTDEVTAYDPTSIQGSGTADADAVGSLFAGNIPIAPTNPLKGTMHWLAIYATNTTLAQKIRAQIGFARNDIQMLTNAGPCRLLVRFDGSSTITDLSGQGNNGTVSGPTLTNGPTIFAPSVWGRSTDAINQTNYQYTLGHAQWSATTTATNIVVSIEQTLTNTYNAQGAITVFLAPPGLPQQGRYFGQMLIGQGRGFTNMWLPGTNKIVTLWNGVRSRPASGIEEGTFLTSVQFNSNAVEVIPATYHPTNTWVLGTDSISAGFLPDPSGQYGLAALLFTNYPLKSFVWFGGGGWQWNDFATNTFRCLDTITNIDTMGAQNFLAQLGINDQGRGNWTTNEFFSGMTNFYARAKALIVNLAATTVTLPSTGTGDTGFEIWRVMQRLAANGLSWVTIREGVAFWWDGNNPGSDGNHPGNISIPGTIGTNAVAVIGP